MPVVILVKIVYLYSKSGIQLFHMKKDTCKLSYHAPTAQILSVRVERGFAATAPGFGEGGPW